MVNSPVSTLPVITIARQEDGTALLSWPGQYVERQVWQQFVSENPQSPFEPRTIFKSSSGRWLWQVMNNTQFDITNWKLQWNTDGGAVSMTMDEFVASA
jgi:hypothetical protein